MLQNLFIYAVGGWVLVLSLIAFTAFGMDKRKARRGTWRISENTLLLLCAAGGAFGGFAGMYLFHHKTRKKKFSVLVPVFCIFWAGLLLFFVLRGNAIELKVPFN